MCRVEGLSAGQIAAFWLATACALRRLSTGWLEAVGSGGEQEEAAAAWMGNLPNVLHCHFKGGEIVKFPTRVVD